ncbi:hypothetical protein TCAL_04664, partial [Tigriopus californicus]|eukprot:TCALIF_04664-PA protein Name:"Similar to mRpL45 Probable 39S ribosomal protein L45, mitochondrial (Drosophila melanogaster)" AED:0.07 eAED:0.07 QI:68/1/1/1/0.85/0.87/8/91/366
MISLQSSIKLKQIVSGVGSLSGTWHTQRALHVTPLILGWGNEHKPIPRGRFRPNRHWHPENRKARAMKILRPDLPDSDFLRKMQSKEASPAEIRDFYKERGLMRHESDNEIPVYTSCTGMLMEPFEPPEGDGKASLLSKQGAKDSALVVQRKGKTLLATRKLRRFEEDFDPRQFAEASQEIYIQAHEALARHDEDDLHKYATEKAYPEMLYNTENKTIYWKFIKSLEPPKTVQIRANDAFTKNNLFAQVTVRFHSQQILAVYDRFGRLIQGHPTVAKDVLEYVVFEKHAANLYGTWRVHGKIIPDWQDNRTPGRLTRVLRKDEAPMEEEIITDEEATKSNEAESSTTDESDAPIYDRFNRVIAKSK